MLKIIQFGYESVFDGQLVQVKNYLEKLMVLEQSDLKIKLIVEPHFNRVIDELRKLLKEYIAVHKSSSLPFESGHFRKLKMYEENYDAIM